MRFKPAPPRSGPGVSSCEVAGHRRLGTRGKIAGFIRSMV